MANIPEIPLDPSISSSLRAALEAMRNTIQVLQAAVAPRPPSNLVVTPVDFGNIIQFTRSDAHEYLLYVSTTGSLADATVRPIGDIAQYTDYVGKSGITLTYWVAAKSGELISDPTGPKSGTTLASGVAATVPTPPPATDNAAADVDTGRPTIGPGYRGTEV